MLRFAPLSLGPLHGRPVANCCCPLLRVVASKLMLETRRGEQLGLRWWIAVPLEGPEGTPAALWGPGGRDGGRPVPSETAISALAEATRADLTQEDQRAMLRAHLTRA